MPTTSTSTQVSESQLAHQLNELGIQRGGTLMVHAALSAVGRVNGGPATVLRALRRVLGPDGTVVVPTFTSDNSDSSSAHLERVRGLSEEARAAVRDSLPPFDPASTPSTGMGILAETVRRHPDSLRSAHPQTSFAALGPKAEDVIADHRPDCHLGEDSPLARLYEMRAEILLMGVGFDRCTAFHLGEYRVSSPPHRTYRCVIRVDGQRQWWAYDDVALDDSDFGALGEQFERAEIPGAVRSSSVGAATCRLVQFVDAVEYAKRWFPDHRRMA
ncbi:aminoglycoside N(3)-acetyltransferase [Streptomyces sp. NPDC060064]|uniref:aminoglycoside N(3)-acetyltransferase n=1 Tax=Streptomyces sp. NPDC060064 TaxID=3347049 RepID=UPI0036CBC2B9